MKFSKRAIELFNNGVAEGMSEKENPFFTEKGFTYFRFDGIRIEFMKDAFGGLNLHYRWHGQDIYIDRLEGSGDINNIEISGFEGKMRVILSLD